MKKTYLKPNTEVINVELQQMIAASLTLNETPGDGGVVLAPEGDFFDLDEDFDF